MKKMFSKLAPRLEVAIQPQKVSHVICILVEKVMYFGSGGFSIHRLVEMVSIMTKDCVKYTNTGFH